MCCAISHLRFKPISKKKKKKKKKLTSMYNEHKNRTWTWLGNIENGKAIKKKKKDTLRASTSNVVSVLNAII